MKKILFAAAVVVLASCASTPAPAPVSAPTSPKVEATPTPAPKILTYEEGLPTSIKTFYPNGDPSGSVTMKYTPQGLLLLQETYNGNGVLTETRTGKAKDGVWRITVTNAQSGEVLSFEDRVVNAQGDLMSRTVLNVKEIPQTSDEYEYDALGHLVLWVAKTGGVVQAKTVYKYDAKGNGVRTEVSDAGGVLTDVFELSYDDQGQLAVRKGFDASGNLKEQTNFTWKDGKKIKQETTKPLLRTFEYTYGDKNLPTGIVSSVRGKIVERQVLEYQWFTRTRTVAP